MHDCFFFQKIKSDGHSFDILILIWRKQQIYLMKAFLINNIFDNIVDRFNYF